MPPGPVAPQNLRRIRRWPRGCASGPPLAGLLDMTLEGRRIEVQGTVQGVGFRPWIYRLASGLGLGGTVHNDARGVTIEAYGHREALDRFLQLVQATPPPAAAIRRLTWESIPARDQQSFEIAVSRDSKERRASIPPDLATCPDCIAEIFDVGDRRYRYPFTNCTNCGPRFTIARDVPYDRPATSMARFPMCADCLREYEDRDDRRFHAQPNACPRCGPRLRLLNQSGEEVATGDCLRWVSGVLTQGAIVAVKGIGGFHLACDATSSAAVASLRLRKHRDVKPFAVMVRALDQARRLANLTAGECQLLESLERPIVLARRAVGSGRSRGGRPRTTRCRESCSPTRPLHHLLLADAGRPLVMTSGNLSDEPIAYGRQRPGIAPRESPISSSSTTGRSSPAATTRWPRW